MPSASPRATTRSASEVAQYRFSSVREYWDSFYAEHAAPEIPSPFAVEVADSLDGRHVVIDIGCGNGRDSRYFASQGHVVVCLDASEVGVRDAVEQSGPDAMGFTLDLADESTLIESIGTVVGTHPELRVVAYVRFLVHAVDDRTEARLLDGLARVLPAGSHVRLEFRVTGPDVEYVHGGHYRRLIDLSAFRRRAEAAGLRVAGSRVSDAFAVYGSERPLVARVELIR